MLAVLYPPPLWYTLQEVLKEKKPHSFRIDKEMMAIAEMDDERFNRQKSGYIDSSSSDPVFRLLYCVSLLFTSWSIYVESNAKSRYSLW